MLSNKQVRAAWLRAHGRADAAIIEAVGVHKTTYYRWLKLEEFLDAVRAAEDKASAENPATPEEAAADLQTARDDDRNILAIQRELFDEVSAFSLDVIKHMRQEGAENFSPRAFPALVKILIETGAALQSTTDRLIGIESLLNDIEKIEAALSTAESENGEA